ncbi:flagellar motor protein PomA [Alsobacter soli]|uniref:Flagellar motor protein PomA n=1 Tax=Alsobacter soli TaxID=2109933 RepID=A0A2T1HT98_9HYPH|nr:MotA/TolQ/ExbB proton channel family protein [Alsobacter soli]PSC04870.1 flagellar motor protein PomA [Alsobacter soli]
MDLATGVGLAIGMGVVTTLIVLGGGFGQYYDMHAVIVIGGGCTAATIIRFPFSAMAHGLPMGAKFAFSMRKMHPRDLIEEIAKIADVVRKSGPMALESVQVDDAFLAQGIRFLADGYDRDFIRDTMERDRDNFLQRLDEGQKIYRHIGDAAPAWGMIGTLVGMVQMFANMEDPSKLGPFMAVSLLATLYGALVGNLFCLPLADKLHLKLEEEDISRTLIIDGILQIRDAKSPTIVKEMLLAYLSEHDRHAMAEAA